MGRSCKLTETVVGKICDAIAIGATNRIAGLYAGVGESTIIKWLNDGREELKRQADGSEPDPDKAKFVAFLRKYEKAEASAYIGWLQVIDNSAQNNPQWASYMLERRDRAYVARSGIDLTSDGGPITFKVAYENKRGISDSSS